VAETNALLKRHTGNRIEGSNPSVSANVKWLILLKNKISHFTRKTAGFSFHSGLREPLQAPHSRFLSGYSPPGSDAVRNGFFPVIQPEKQ
jgi:hypothetical protein